MLQVPVCPTASCVGPVNEVMVGACVPGAVFSGDATTQRKTPVSAFAALDADAAGVVVGTRANELTKESPNPANEVADGLLPLLFGVELGVH